MLALFFFAFSMSLPRQSKGKEEGGGDIWTCLEWDTVYANENGKRRENNVFFFFYFSYLRRTPPRREALRHSGGERRRWTSPTVTLYLEVDDKRDRRPGTEQNTSVGETGPDSNTSFVLFNYYDSTKPREKWKNRKKTNKQINKLIKNEKNKQKRNKRKSRKTTKRKTNSSQPQWADT